MDRSIGCRRRGFIVNIQSFHEQYLPAEAGCLRFLRHEHQPLDLFQHLVRRQLVAMLDHRLDKPAKGDLPFAHYHHIDVAVLEHGFVIAGGIGAAGDDHGLDAPLADHGNGFMVKFLVVREGSNADHMGIVVFYQALQFIVAIKVEPRLGDFAAHPVSQMFIQIGQQIHGTQRRLDHIVDHIALMAEKLRQIQHQHPHRVRSRLPPGEMGAKLSIQIWNQGGLLGNTLLNPEFVAGNSHKAQQVIQSANVFGNVTIVFLHNVVLCE